MKLRRRQTLIVVTGLALASLVPVSASATQEATGSPASRAPSQLVPSAVAGADGCITKTNAAGDPRWTSEAGPALSKAADQLQAIADEHPGDVSGVVLCTDMASVEILVKGSGGTAAAAISQVQAAAGARVLVRQVQHSLTDLLAEQKKVLRTAKKQNIPVSGANPDIQNDGLAVSVQVPADKAAAFADPSSASVSTLSAQLQTTFPLRVRVSNSGTSASTRAADVSPFKMGGQIYGSSGGGTTYCSLGVPVVVLGQHMALTAGHCTPTSWFNNGRSVGTQYTTAWPGNADIYGDWKLISGSSYSLSVFNGTLSSSSTLPLVGGNWGSRPLGSGLCASGRTTGQTCRYFVISNYADEIFSSDGVEVYPMVESYHDSDLDGNSDQSGWEPGDSGGPCYHSSGSGLMADGIVKGWINWGPFSNGQTYYCTMLAGLQNWAPAAYVG